MAENESAAPAASPARPPGAAPAESFGRVGEDGTVYLRLPDGSERKVGAWAAGDASDGLSHFARKYYELVSEIDIAAKRLADDRTTPGDAQKVANRIRDSLSEPGFVGDLAALVARVGQLEVLVNVKKAALLEQKAQARDAALAQRKELVEKAEKLANSTSFKAGVEQFRSLIDEWKSIDRFDRSTEDELWQRMSRARKTFDSRRREHYAQLEEQFEQAQKAKEKLIKEAEKLSASRDWAGTTKAYRQLMDRWKAAGRAGKTDDELWSRFRAAQDAFFAARNEVFAQRDEEESANKEVKEKLLTEAQALLPITNLGSAKKALRSIQERWEKAGRVPRDDVKRLEGGLKKIEEAVRDAEQQQWRARNPELRGRAADTVSQFQVKVDKLQAQLQAAVEAGDEAASKKLREALEGAQMLLDAAQKGLSRFG